MTFMNPTTADTGFGSSSHLSSRDPLLTSPQRSSADWQTYHAYAQQLHAAGDHEGAEAYYLCAQQLYYTGGVQSSDEYRTAGPTGLLSSNDVAMSVLSVEGVQPKQLDLYQRPQVHKRRRRVVVGTFVFLIFFALLLVEIANILLLDLYQHQKSQKKPYDYDAMAATAPFYIRPLLKLPVKEPVLSMVSAMQHTLERGIRISQSAEPLLYELGLRSALPEHHTRTDTVDVKPKTSANTTDDRFPAVAAPSPKSVSLSSDREANHTADVLTWKRAKKTVKAKTPRGRQARARAGETGRNQTQQRAKRKSGNRTRKRNTHANRTAPARRKSMVKSRLSDDPLADLKL